MNKLKYAIAGAISVALGLAGKFALAKATCTVNGKEVPCSGLGGLGIGLMAGFFVLWIVILVFWLLMLIHAASKPIENKAMWIVVLVFTNVIGALLYYFMVKRKFAKQTPPPK